MMAASGHPPAAAQCKARGDRPAINMRRWRTESATRRPRYRWQVWPTI